MDENPLPLIRLLIARLERISADSVWAHRASGIRGYLFKTLEEYETFQVVDEQTLSQVIEGGFKILLATAHEKQTKSSINSPKTTLTL
jgi:hypothetical protein